MVLFFGSKLVALLLVFTLPRALNLMLKPDRTYQLYGFHYSVHRTISRLTNRKFFHELFGDSSYIVHYLRGLGYRLSPVVQTGSNFGMEVKHENPYLSSVGSGTQVAAGLTFINADYSSTSFRLSRASIGPNNFLGNEVVYPPQGRTGDNCLLATKVLVPIDGEIRENVGALGSPSFRIPRSVERDSRFAQVAHGDDFPRRLAAKDRYNRATIRWVLLARWFYYFVLTLVMFVAADLYDSMGAWTIALANVLILIFSVFYLAMLERASTGFRGVRPMQTSIYEIDFWRVERFFKFCARVGLHRIFNGTPFKAVLWRLVGVRVGKRLFDDGTTLAEKNIVSIGDDVTLNAASGLQCHSQEDYAYKCDGITVGSGCTVGVGAMVHYGVTMGDGAVLAADSFLMKGEEMPPHAHWGGNPAREMPDLLVAKRTAPRDAAPAIPRPVIEWPVVDRRARRHPAAVPATGVLVALAAVAGLGVANWSGLSSPAPALPASGPAAAAPLPLPAAPAPNPAPLPVAAPVPATVRWFEVTDVPLLDSGLRAGSRGDGVVSAQQQLQRLGYYAGPANGEMDGATDAAVRRFQEVAGVTGDPAGTVGRATAVALLAGGDRPVLGVGAHGEDVHRLQHALAVALNRPLPPTGDFLSMTQQAVRDFQASRGLPIVGTVAAATWTALQQGR